jgi:hypothetical protein
MANWASTAYAIEGPHETLEKIEKAILEHPVEEGSSEDWEGNILKALGIEWEAHTPDGKGYYMRGFIQDVPWWDGDTLRFYAEEAWGATDFNEVLEKNIPDIKVFYTVEEPGCEVYATNDKEGKYFPDRYWVDTCIDNNYQSEYFQFESSVYKWLHDITDGKVSSAEDAEKFNSDHEDAGDDDENFINIHVFKVIE